MHAFKFIETSFVTNISFFSVKKGSQIILHFYNTFKKAK